MGTDGEHETGVLTGSVADLTGMFRFGIEEEYFLVDADTKAIAPTVPEALFSAVKTSTLGRGKAEFLQQQVEVTTEPHVDMVKARAELRLWFPKIPSGRIRAVRQNQRIISCDAHDPPSTWNVCRHSAQVAAPA